jgi:hypothetical protein
MRILFSFEEHEVRLNQNLSSGSLARNKMFYGGDANSIKISVRNISIIFSYTLLNGSSPVEIERGVDPSIVIHALDPIS